MSTYQRIKDLANEHHMSISELERTLNLSNGSLSKWDKSKPNSKYLEIVADYFDVSTDYLLGRDATQVHDPISYFRIDTRGLTDEQILELRKDLEEYSDWAKQRLQKNDSGE